MRLRRTGRQRLGDLIPNRAVVSLYAWVARAPDGAEALVYGLLPGAPGWTPLVGPDRRTVEGYRGHAEMCAKVTGYTVNLVMFGEGHVLDEIHAERPLPN